MKSKQAFKKIIAIIFLCIPLIENLQAQMTRTEKLDSAFHDPFLFPAVSASILPKGFVEINSFNSVMSGTKRFNNEGKSFENNIKTSIFSSTTQVSYGVSKKGRFNIGVDLSYLAYRLDTDTESSMLKVLGSSEAFASDKYLSHVGFRVRYLPFLKRRNFLIQHTFEIPVNKEIQLQNRFNSQFVYIHSFSRKLFLFNQIDIRYIFARDALKTSFSTPYTGLLSYLVKPKLQVFGLINYTPLFIKSNTDFMPVYIAQTGFGLQYQFSTRFGLNFFWNRHFMGKNIEQNTGLNLGLRAII